jgi:hypothetical protein
MRADVHASGLILTLTAIALLGTNKGRHYLLSLLANNPLFFRSSGPFDFRVLPWPAAYRESASGGTQGFQIPFFIEISLMKRSEAITLERASIIPIFDCRISRANCFHNLFDLDQMPCFSHEANGPIN